MRKGGPPTISKGICKMTFRYGLTIPALGGNKLRRFKQWAHGSLPDLEYRLPPQAPIETDTLTIRLRSPDDGKRIRETLAGGSLP
jgi:hypothetical protein